MKSLSLLLALAAAAGASAAGAAGAEPGPPLAPEATGASLAAFVAAETQARVPIATGPGSSIVAARAEGNVLVWTIQVPKGHFDDARARTAAAGGEFRQGFCRTGSRILFERGVALRVDVTDGRRPALSFPLITDCPPLG